MIIVLNIFLTYFTLYLLEKVFDFLYVPFGVFVCYTGDISVDIFHDFFKFSFVCFEIILVVLIIHKFNKWIFNGLKQIQ